MSLRRFPIAVAAAAVAVAWAAPAHAAYPPTLGGTMLANSNTTVLGECDDVFGNSTVGFSTSGVATGGYAGTFSIDVRGAFSDPIGSGRGPWTRLDAPFRIRSASRDVEGWLSLPGVSSLNTGQCTSGWTEDSWGLLLRDLRYTAIITTSDGCRYEDRGNATLSAFNSSFLISKPFTATFSATLDHPAALDPACGEDAGNTPLGTDVALSPGEGVEITFDWVYQPGNTTVTTSTTGPAEPAGFMLGDPARYYELATTAGFSTATVCLPRSGITFSGTSALFHYENGAWVDVTTSVDLDKVCGSVSSFSPFALFSADDEPPTVECTAPDSSWHGDDVTLACTAADAGSGLADPADASFALTTSVPEGTETSDAQTGSRSVCDRAANCTTAGPIGGIKVDKKAPQIVIVAPSGAYVLNASVAASYSCTDGGSGLAGCSGPVASGGSVDTSSVGAWTLDVAATDAVGNAATSSSAYTVSYALCRVGGLERVANVPRALPIVLDLCDANGAVVSSPAVSVRAAALDGGPANAPGRSFPDGLFGWQGGSYRYVLKTEGLAPGAHVLAVRADGDPVLHELAFETR